jgi:hypothetical protein
MAFDLSDHAIIRCQERQVPDLVLERINDGAFLAQALEDDGRISNFRIVRVGIERFWVAVEREGVIVTIIPVGFIGSSARDWFGRRLLNFRHVMPIIESLPVTSTRRLRRQHTHELIGRHQRRNHGTARREAGNGWREPNEAVASEWGMSV